MVVKTFLYNLKFSKQLLSETEKKKKKKNPRKKIDSNTYYLFLN